MGRVTKFLGMYNNSHTLKNYRQGLRHFFKSVYGEGDVHEQAEKYFKEERDHEEDFNNFLKYLNSSPPKTIRLRISTARTFLSENDIELPQKFWRRLNKRIKGSQARTMDRVPKNTELRRIMLHLPIHGKALFLTLASSGMRIGETLQLQLDDITLDHDPAKVSIRGEYTKTGNPRIAFISGEAKEAIQEWLRNRDAYIQSAVKKSTLYKKSAKDKHLFPFKDNVAYRLWNGALDKAGVNRRDKATKFHELHIHVLRKFFRTRMGGAINKDVVEALMGHEGYLTGQYRRYSVEELANSYQQGEHVLHVFTDGEKVGELRKEVEAKNRQLQQVVNTLSIENLQIKDQLRQLTDHNQIITKLQQELTIQKRLTNLMTTENLQIHKAIKAIVKTLLSEHPHINTIQDDEGRLYENKVVGINLDTGTFKTEHIEITDEEKLKNWNELCDLLDRTPQILDTILDDHNLNLKLE